MTESVSPALLTPDMMAALQTASNKMAEMRAEVGRHIYGQETAVLDTMTALLSGGHVLLLGLPGLAKTRLVVTLAKIMGLDTKRIQCTPDLMPSDVIGAEILEEGDYGKRNFRFVQGPIFAQFLMVDEINRASPRTQSALLQAMQEKNVTVGGREHALPAPFHVLATQNPLEQEGIYPLPEAQLDRFLLQIEMTYPDIDAERQMVKNTVMGVVEPAPKTLIYANDLKDLQQLVRMMPLPDTVLNAILTLVRGARPGSSSIDLVRKYVAWGPGPRASQAMSLAVRARALLLGRFAPDLDDVRALIKPIFQHRMALNFMARADGVGMSALLTALADQLDGASHGVR